LPLPEVRPITLDVRRSRETAEEARMASRRRSAAPEPQGELGASAERAEPPALPRAPRPPKRRGGAPPERPAGSPRIWAIGGGKGGVGKSVVSSSLAVAIAGTGRRCAVIDADLGGANLHTLLGVSRPRRTVSHLLTGEVGSLAELMVQTSIPNLWLVSGDQALLEIANPKHSQKEKLFRHIRGLDVDDVVLDLGAGSAFTVLDFFLIARRKLVVVTPEPTAIENAEHFIRAALYRSLRGVAKRPEVRAAILRARESRGGAPAYSAAELIECVREVDPLAAKLLDESAQAFTPMLLVNQVRSAEQRSLGAQLVASCRDRLGVPIALAGSLDADPNVPVAVAQRQPVLQAFPRCEFSRRIEALAQHLLRDDGPVAARVDGRGAPSRARGTSPPQRALPPLDLDHPGAYLRGCREALGLSLDEMIERTRIRALEHIEQESFELLPPEPYLKGYLLSYTQELGVPDFARLVAYYLARVPQAPARRGSGLR
jgi:flagellar biosynthesis protein FlhG